MAREKKRYELKQVEDKAVEKSGSFIRLETNDRDFQAEVPLIIHDEDDDSSALQKLNVPTKEEAPSRSHEPGIETLIDSPAGPAQGLEQTWGSESSASSRIPWGWFALLGLILSAALVWSLTKVDKSQEQAKIIEQSANTTLTKDQESIREATELIETIEKTIRQYFKANTIEERLEFVRHPERVKALMETYYGEQKFPLVSEPVVEIISLQPITLEKLASFWMANVTLQRSKGHDLIFEVLKTGEVKIDWETLVCYQPVKWEDFVMQRPSGQSLDFRIYIEQNDLFSHEFADSSRWNCFRISTLNSDEIVYGYSEVGSQVSKDILAQIAENSGQRVALILRLEIPDGLQSRQGTIIEKVISNNWIFVKDPGGPSP